MAANLPHSTKSDDYANCAALYCKQADPVTMKQIAAMLKIQNLEVLQQGLLGGTLEADPQEALQEASDVQD